MKKNVFWSLCIVSVWISSCRKAPAPAPMPSFMTCTIQDQDSSNSSGDVSFNSYGLNTGASFLFDTASHEHQSFELVIRGYYGNWKISLRLSHLPGNDYKGTFDLPDHDPNDPIEVDRMALLFYAPNGFFPESQVDYQNGTWFLNGWANYAAPGIHGSITISELDTIHTHSIRGSFQGVFYGYSGTYKRISDGKFFVAVKDSIDHE